MGDSKETSSGALRGTLMGTAGGDGLESNFNGEVRKNVKQ